MTQNILPGYRNGTQRSGHVGDASCPIEQARADDSLFNHSAARSDGMRLRIMVPNEWAGTKRAISKYDWQQTLSISRQLFGRCPEVMGAMLQKSTYVIGDSWQPRFVGKDRAWGDLAEQWLSEVYFPSANMRGEPYDFITSLFVDSLHIDRDGDSAMALVDHDGQPRVQFISAHRIGTRWGCNGFGADGMGTMSAGKFKGAKIYNGVIFDAKGRVLGYNILGEDGDGKSDAQLTTAQCQVLYEPQFSDQGRGIPSAASALLSFMDYEDIHHFLKRQVKQDSAQGLLHYNEDGAVEDTQDFITDPGANDQNQDVKVEKLEGNEILYFKANGGGKLEAFRSDRPHPNVDAYTMRILRGALQSMGWFFELYDPSKVGGASTRLIQDMARASVQRRQSLIRKRWIRAVAHGLSFAMRNGDLPVNTGPEWIYFEPTLPGKITVDARYDEQTKMDRIKLGAGTYAAMFGDEGKWWEQEMRQRILEQKFLQDECAKAGVDPAKIQILSPAQFNFQQPQGESEPAKDDSK